MACDRVLGETLPACIPRLWVSKIKVLEQFDMLLQMSAQATSHGFPRPSSSNYIQSALYHNPQLKPCLPQEGQGPPRATQMEALLWVQPSHVSSWWR